MLYRKRIRDLREDHDKSQQEIAEIREPPRPCMPGMSGAPTNCPCGI